MLKKESTAHFLQLSTHPKAKWSVVFGSFFIGRPMFVCRGTASIMAVNIT